VELESKAATVPVSSYSYIHRNKRLLKGKIIEDFDGCANTAPKILGPQMIRKEGDGICLATLRARRLSMQTNISISYIAGNSGKSEGGL
jgi:hypothetical protein